ncbi:DUF2288 family protein [Aliikangiella marina]|uniref:DUF2288 family protein n=1 Tax=Aliikangiella marina TaxID=1712262 RepID=UPI00163DA3DA|nr:DUF2288 family protein [Aliikangiella marina]
MSETEENLEIELSLKDKLNLETAKISWKELELFFAKGNLLTVSPSKNLIEVAEQIASNQQKEIESLILEKNIEFATPSWVRENCSENPTLWAVVVAPYVVCQLATETSH